MATVAQNVLASSPVLIPPLSEQKIILQKIDKDCEQVGSAIERAQREISLLREYHTRLIADVVTGKLDVREASESLHDEAEEPELVDESDAMSAVDEEPVDDLDIAPEEVEA